MSEEHTINYKKAYVVAVDMGYGHQRAVFPLLDISATPIEWGIKEPIIISANDYPGIPTNDKFEWSATRKTYEWISRANGFPILGKQIFNAMDFFQHIPAFYPRRDLSKPTAEVQEFYAMIKRGFGKHLVDILNKEPLPLITSFFIPAFCAEEHGYKGEIFCLCTDTDIARAWAPLHPQKSRINYLAPNNRVRERLLLYGIRPEKIFMTGFPLPKDMLTEKNELDVLHRSLARRIRVLDPQGYYRKKYTEVADLSNHKEYDGINSTLTITFAVGGAGAQAAIGVTLLKSLNKEIKTGKVRLILVAGTSLRVLQIYEQALKENGLKNNDHVRILYDPNKFEYFRMFNIALTQSDILWTKPSELSFYVGLGLPIIIAPPLGSQEDCNKAWLHIVGAGFEQDDPRYANEWLFDWIQSGWLAEAAVNGYFDAPKRGTYRIEDLVLRGELNEIEDMHFI